MNNPARFLITAALPYANGPLHIGHLAGAYLPADIYVRYLRRLKKDVLFICGSDEHGAAITIQAKKENITPKQIVDKYHLLIKKTFIELGISFDIYHRTSEKIHHETSQEFFLNLYQKGVFEEIESEQYYDETFHQFLADRYIIGTCPVCSNQNAFGDQCEKCGSSLSPEDLISPISTLSNLPPIKKKTKHWYLPLNKYQDWLQEWIIDGVGRTEDWKKNVIGQCSSWLKDGLHPRAITRDLDWGVKVPLSDAEGKVLYVWMDAPIGYISATKQWALDHQKNWEPYWKDPSTKLLHFIGKDNIVFHCLIFPCILKSHGDFILPTNVPANEFMNLEGEKISTSRNWNIQLHEYLQEFPGKEDVMRYALASNLPETKDSEFTWKDFQAKNNNELVAILGNYVNRVLVLTHKFFEGKIPEIESSFLVQEYVVNHQNQIQNIILDGYQKSIENYRFRDALAFMMDVVRAGNKFLTDFEPWKLINQNVEQTKNVLRYCLESLIDIAILAEPFLPFTAEKLFAIFNVESINVDLGKMRLIEGESLAQPFYLFDKIEDEIIQKKIDQLIQIKENRLPKVQAEIEEIKPVINPTIQYDDFLKLDLRTGVIVGAEKVKNADKLLKLQVDIGFESRTIVSGIAQHFNPEEILNQKVVVLINLQPRNIKGIESNGMILMAEDKMGKLTFIQSADDVSRGLSIS